MSFGDHLEELRRRMLLALALPVPLFVVFFVFSDPLVKLLVRPVYSVFEEHGLPLALQVLSPQEFLLTQLKLSMIAAVVAAAPWILWQAWSFVAPGLYRHERRFVHFLIPGSFLLTCAGVALLYFVMLPLMLHVLVMLTASADVGGGVPPRPPEVQAYLDAAAEIPIRTAQPAAPAAGDAWLLAPEMELYVAVPDKDAAITPYQVRPLEPGRIDQAYRISSVVNFTLVLLLGIVIAFQMPLVILLLGWLDLASVAWLRAKRRYALFICAAVAAIVTPADALSMIMMLVPLYALYELGIVLLVIAPASAVAEGRLPGLGGRGEPKGQRRAAAADKPVARAEQAGEPSQSDAPVPRRRDVRDRASGKPDGEDGDERT